MLGSPHVELDSIYHQPDWTPLGEEEFRARVTEATESPHWVVDGNYSVVQEVVWQKADRQRPPPWMVRPLNPAGTVGTVFG